MTDYDIAMALNREVQNSNTHWNTAEVFRERPTLKPVLVSLLAYSVGKATVLYLHATIADATDPDALVRITAFTDETIAIVTGFKSPSARTLSRSSLQAITIDEAPNLLSSDWSTSKALRLSLDYGEALGDVAMVTLGHELQTPKNVSELETFLPTLQADLLR